MQSCSVVQQCKEVINHWKNKSCYYCFNVIW